MCKPLFRLDEGGAYQASPGQKKFLWPGWLDYCEQVRDTAREYKAKKVVGISNGDLVEGDTKFRSKQIITRNIAQVVRASVETIMPMVDVVDHMFVLRGTEAHTGGSGELEELVAEDLTNVVPSGEICIDSKGREKYTRYSWWDMYYEFDGVIMDVSHHGKLGLLPWTRVNALHRLAEELILAYVKSGKKLPHLAFRAHRHKKADTFDNHPIRVIALPCWQLATAYVHRLGSPEPADVGGTIVVCDRGDYEIIKCDYKPKPARPKRLK